jgi:hypothetical protein
MPRRTSKFSNVTAAVVLLAGIGYAYVDGHIAVPGLSPWSQPAQTALYDAFTGQQSNLQVSGTGIVVKTLSDDRDGARHQRFILDVGNGQTVLVAHNIDLAPRIDNLAIGNEIQFNGEYEYNNRGGVVHWTHRDPSGRHPDGWLRHAGRTYQ